MKYLIVNADDLGFSEGVNEGIIKGFKEGIITSTSLMVYGSAKEHALRLAKQNPHLGLGLHFQIDKDEAMLLRQLRKAASIALIEKTKHEFLNQVNEFQKLTGTMPDHIDSHFHIHRLPRIYQFVKAFCKKNKIPMRGEINFVDSFFGMPLTNRISITALTKILEKLPDGPSELMCHPGLVTPDLHSSYKNQRELELATLTSPEIKHKIKEGEIRLVNWSQLPYRLWDP